jgi:hypothetical protein
MDDRRTDDFARALKGLDFPASRAAIVNKIKDHGGIEGHVIELAEQLPSRVYSWEQDAVREFEEVLQRNPSIEGGIPAAGRGDRT